MLQSFILKILLKPRSQKVPSLLIKQDIFHSSLGVLRLETFWIRDVLWLGCIEACDVLGIGKFCMYLGRFIGGTF